MSAIEAVEAIEVAAVDEPAPVRIGKRVFVSNLAWRTSWQDLKDKFRECGNVVYANVQRSEDGRSKGWGIVEFETPEEAIQAVNTLNGADLGGRRISVREDREDRDVKQYAAEDGSGAPRPPRPPRAPRPGRGERVRPVIEGEPSGYQICVQGIPWKYTWKELKDLFAEVGEVERADVMFAPDGRSKGWGTVRFTSTDAATEAIARFHGAQHDGRTLTVFLDKKA